MLNLQKQPTKQTCVQTCIAMALDVPVEKIVERYGEQGMNIGSLLHALLECDVEHNILVYSRFFFTGYYFAVVPSLNFRGKNHQIIVHYDAARGCKGITVYDPADGETYKSDGSDLCSWESLIVFFPGGRLPTVTER
mgnify:CR=1 FL=1